VKFDTVGTIGFSELDGHNPETGVQGWASKK